MTNILNNVLRMARDEFPVQSLLDVDFYKFTMLYFIWTYYKDVVVRFELINRATTIPLAQVVDEHELRAALDHVRTLRFTLSELAYLRGMPVYGYPMFSEAFLMWLSTLQLPEYHLERKGDQYELSFEAPWPLVTLWETIALAIVNELYYRSLERKMNTRELVVTYARAIDALWQSLQQLKTRPDLKFAEFGKRRRHSREWQAFVLEMCREEMGSQFLGISNTLFAFTHGVVPIGTIAHELTMVATAIAESEEDMRAAQYNVLAQWEELYGGAIRVALPDTYGTAQFLQNAPEFVLDWPAMRQDSGVPTHVADMMLQYWRHNGVNPIDRKIVYSDGLTAETMVQLHDWSQGVVQDGYGQGTELTNGFRNTHPRPEAYVPGLHGLTWDEVYRPISIVCKVVAANGRPAVKLSDNPNKATGPKEEVARYLRIFGGAGREKVAVRV